MPSAYGSMVSSRGTSLSSGIWRLGRSVFDSGSRISGTGIEPVTSASPVPAKLPGQARVRAAQSAGLLRGSIGRRRCVLFVAL